MPYTPEWYDCRKYRPGRQLTLNSGGTPIVRTVITSPVIFGASLAAAVCGVSEWSTPLHVYHEMVTGTGSKDESDAMRLGKKLEPVVISEYIERTGYGCMYPQPMYFHPVHHFLAATPDAMTLWDREVTEELLRTTPKAASLFAGSATAPNSARSI